MALKCGAMSVKDVTKGLKLDWHTIKSLDTEYMQEQVRRNLVAVPRAIRIDEISLRKGHTYRIVASDLERGSQSGTEGKIALRGALICSYVWLGTKKTNEIALAVRDI